MLWWKQLTDRKTILALIVSLLPFLAPLFHSGVYTAHDVESHLARFAAYSEALLDGQLPPRWAGNLNFGFGSPVISLFYPLPNILASILRFGGLSWEIIFKIIAGAAFLAAPLTFYIWVKKHTDKASAFISSLMFGLSSYHFLNLYVRGDLGELLAIIFVPLVLGEIDNSTVTRSILPIIKGGFYYNLLILSHNGAALLFTPIILTYLGLAWLRRKKIIWRISLILPLGLALSSWFWLPTLWEQRYIHEMFSKYVYVHNFPTFGQLVSHSWGFGAQVNEPGGLSPEIGWLPLGLVGVNTLLLMYQKSTRSVFITFWLLILGLSIFLSLQASYFVWDNISLLQKLQFPWRLTLVSSFAAVAVTSQLLKHTQIKFRLLILIMMIFVAIPKIQVSNYTYHPDPDRYYASYSGTTALHGETTPIWTAGDQSQVASEPISIITGEAKVSNYQRQSNQHAFDVYSFDKATILDNTTYYPGWRVFIDNNEVPIQFQDPSHRGLITFPVPQGRHKVQVKFTETKLRFAADLISLTTFVMMIVIYIVSCARPGLAKQNQAL